MHQRHFRGANTIRPTYLRLLSTVKARRIIATLQLAVLALFVSAEQILSYLRFPTPRLMFLVAGVGAGSDLNRRKTTRDVGGRPGCLSRIGRRDGHDRTKPVDPRQQRVDKR